MLSFLRWLKANDDLQFDIKLLQGGPLVPEFAKIAPTEVLAQTPALHRRILRRLVGERRMGSLDRTRLRKRLSPDRYDLAYVNTVVPKVEIALLANAGVPVVCHVHEMEFAIRSWLGRDGLTPLTGHVAHFIAASQAVHDELIRRWRVPESRISIVHEFIADASSNDTPAESAGVRASLSLSDKDVLGGGCGTLDWRKGADLFLQIARSTGQKAASGGKTHFVWLGADAHSGDYERFVYDLARIGLQDRVTLMESRANPGAIFSAMDIFALTSREDPFPLVMLEAAAAALPIVCFAGSGGGPEFACDGAGVVVPYLDVAAFATEVGRLADDAQRRRAIGEIARSRVRERFTIERQAPKLRDVIHESLP